MVSRVVKGAGADPVIELSDALSISLQKKTLTLITTDRTNYLYIKEPKVDGEDFNITVKVDLFSNLISKLTCEDVILSVNEEEGTLEVIGNGSYLIELMNDVDDSVVHFPDPMKDIKFKAGSHLPLSVVQASLTTVKQALLVPKSKSDNPTPWYSAYYVGDKITASDSTKICQMTVKDKLFKEPVLITAHQMELLGVMQADKIDVMIQDGLMIFSSPDCVIYCHILDGIESFAIGPITDLCNLEMEGHCKLPKGALVQVLDRLALFVDEYDKNGVYLTFTKDGLQISSMKSSGIEIIKYLEKEKKVKEFTCCVDIKLLQSQIKALIGDTIDLYYGVDNAIKIIEDNIVQVISLLEDSRTK